MLLYSGIFVWAALAQLRLQLAQEPQQPPGLRHFLTAQIAQRAKSPITRASTIGATPPDMPKMRSPKPQRTEPQPPVRHAIFHPVPDQWRPPPLHRGYTGG